MAKKRKTLPKDFEELLVSGDIEALKAVYDKCEINAYLGYDKETALFLRHIPDELTTWLISQGADINYGDSYGNTALHARAGRGEDISLLIQLGADIEATSRWGDTPLHRAAGYRKVQAVKQLIELGASKTARNQMKLTPLESALSQCQNIDIPATAKVAQVFLQAGDEISPVAKDLVTAIGERFEFHRESFNQDYIEETDAGLSTLYEMFGVVPVKKLERHDGVSLISVSSETWQKQHQELWEYLVPGNGHAPTVQGEVIRITGRISYEVYNNGGTNWDKDFRTMLTALMQYFQSGVPLSNEDMELAAQAEAEIRPSGYGDDEPSWLCELAVKWVLNNLEPLPLGKVDYRR